MRVISSMGRELACGPAKAGTTNPFGVHPLGCWKALLFGLSSWICAVTINAAPEGLLKSEFITEEPPTKVSHSSTLVETRMGFLAAWAGGPKERALNTSIWTARHDGVRWQEPKEAANGFQADEVILYPCWNPVLFRPRFGPLYLFYKIGPDPASWWTMVRSSDDEGQTWSKPKRLPPGIVGPVRNKPVELVDGTLLCGSSTEEAGWRVHVERTRDPFRGWFRAEPINTPLEYAAIQPTILVHDDRVIQILCRTKQGKVVQSWSGDGGITWDRMAPTPLPNPNSALDAVRLVDGRFLLIYNHSSTDRDRLDVAVSRDGKRWSMGPSLEEGAGNEFSYPAVIQASDGRVHVTYSWNKRRIRHLVLDPAKLSWRPLPDEE